VDREQLFNGIMRELPRVRSLALRHGDNGGAGKFQEQRILLDIKASEDAIWDNDVVAMAKAYMDLKEVR